MSGAALTAMGQEFQLSREPIFGFIPEPDFRFRQRLISAIHQAEYGPPVFEAWEKLGFYAGIMIVNIVGAIVGHVISRWFDR